MAEPPAYIHPPAEVQIMEETDLLLPRIEAVSPLISGMSRGKIFALLTTITILVELSMLSQSPQTQIFEEIICHKYYTEIGDQPERLLNFAKHDCKIDAVQNELAFIIGWNDSFSSLPALLLMVPFGALADRIGKKPVFIMSLIGLFFAEAYIRLVCLYPDILPLRLIWASSAFLCLGAGSQMPLLFAMLAELFSPEERANAFFRVTGLSLMVDMVAGPVSAALMLRNPWIPFLIPLPLYIIAIVVFIFVPEIQPVKSVPSEAQPMPDLSPASSFSVRLRIRLASVPEFLSKNIAVVMLTLVFFIIMFPGHPFALLYISKKFGTSLANATFLLTIRTIIKFIVMFFLIPLINGLLSRRLHLPPLIRDLRVAQVSIVILTIGTLLFGLAPSIPIVAIALAIVAAACALPSGLRCVGMHLTPPERLGTVSTFMAWVVNASGLVTGPFYAQAYKVGLSMGVPGLPYLIVTAALGVCCAVLVLMPLPKDQLVGEERMNESRYRGDADSETEGC